MIYQILMILTCYLIGSIPTAYIIVKIFKGIDIRQYGSGNVGATNVLRILGKTGFAVTLVIDILKGFLPVFFAKLFLTGGSEWPLNKDLFLVLCAVSVISGHIWTIFLNFKGGKGVATATGAFLAIAPDAMGLTAIVWLITIFITRIVSLSSIISAVCFCVFMFVFKKSLLIKIIGIALSMLIIYKHKANIKRLAQGKEPKIGR